MLRLTLTVLLLCSWSAAVEVCGPTMTWSTSNGHLMLNGHPFVLKGMSYYGFELDWHELGGLWTYSLDQILDFIQSNGFNALRVPFSMELVKLNPSHLNINCQTNPQICNMSALNLMEAFIDRCADRGILVILNCHALSVADGIPELWYSSEYPEAEVLQLWDRLLARLATKWNLMALDMENEPHNTVTWGRGNPATDFDQYAERFIDHIAKRHPLYKGLFFVEGIDIKVCNPDSSYFFWGENLRGVHCKPVNLTNQELTRRVIYTPHVYGPEEFAQPYFNDHDFPKNMPDIWEAHFGFVRALTSQPVIIGEWAWEAPGSSGEVWGHAFADWMTENCMTNQIWWTLNPGKYGLIGDDYKTGNAAKLAFLHALQPNPTTFVVRKGNICIRTDHSPIKLVLIETFDMSLIEYRNYNKIRHILTLFAVNICKLKVSACITALG